MPATTSRKAIVHCRLIDGTGAPPLDDATVLIEGDRIAAAGPARSVEVPPGAEVYDARRPGGGALTVLPGLIDAHVHIVSTGDPNPLKRLKQTPAYMGIRGAAHARAALEAGFTALRDAGAPYRSAFAVRQAIHEGVIPGPRLQAPGQGLSITGGHADAQNGWPDEVRFPGRSAVVDGVDAARRAAREQLRDGADLIKLHATGGVMSEGDSPTARGLTLEEMRAAIEEAENVGKRAMAHAQGALGIKNAILAGVRSIEHGFYLTDEIIELMLRRDVFLVPTLAAVHHIVVRGVAGGIPAYGVEKAKRHQEAHLASFRKARDAGVKIAMGTDAGTPFNYHGENALELQLMVDAGMTPMEAIVATTSRAAELMDWGDRTGSVRAGHWADLVVIDGDPLADLRCLQETSRLKLVLKGGEVAINRGLEPREAVG